MATTTTRCLLKGVRLLVHQSDSKGGAMEILIKPVAPRPDASGGGSPGHTRCQRLCHALMQTPTLVSQRTVSAFHTGARTDNTRPAKHTWKFAAKRLSARCVQGPLLTCVYTEGGNEADDGDGPGDDGGEAFGEFANKPARCGHCRAACKQPSVRITTGRIAGGGFLRQIIRCRYNTLDKSQSVVRTGR